MNFSRLQTDLPGLVLIQAKAFHDPRGYFMELFNADSLKSCGIEEVFLQDNLSYSSKGTLRGLHFQAPPFAQGKLVTVLQGNVLDVVLDIRKGSPTYGQYAAFELSEQNRHMLYVPPGFAHGFSVLSDTALFHYKCTQVYHKSSEGGVLWNDPALHIDWKVQSPIISEKDTLLPALHQLDSPFTY
jgi:dTDP-4-dehydrorhamnose 3,5-epimerase